MVPRELRRYIRADMIRRAAVCRRPFVQGLPEVVNSCAVQLRLASFGAVAQQIVAANRDP